MRSHPLPAQEEPLRHRILEVRTRPLVTLLAWAGAITLGLYFLSVVKLVGLGFLVACAVAAAMRPLRDAIPGPRWLGGTIAGVIPALLGAGVVALISWIVVGPLQDQLAQWGQVERGLNELLARWAHALGVPTAPTVSDLADRLRLLLIRREERVVTTTASTIAGVLVVIAFLFFGSFYLLTERERRLLGPLLELLPPDRRPQVAAAVHALEPKLRWWLIGTVTSMTVVGLASWAGFTALGLKMAVPLATLAALSEVIPTVGPALAFLVALMVGFTQGTSTAIGVAVIYLTIQLLESYVLLPLIMRQVVLIPPVATLFTVVLWGQVFGAAGLLLAIPIDLVLWTFADHLFRRPDANLWTPAPAPPPPGATSEATPRELERAGAR